MLADTQFRAVAFQEGDVWIAQALEVNIMAQAPTPRELPYAFMRAIVENFLIAEQLGQNPLTDIGPAPQRFHQMFEEARRSNWFVGIDDELFADEELSGLMSASAIPKPRDVKIRFADQAA